MRSDAGQAKAGFGLSAAAWFGVLFLNVPILFIILYCFTTDDRSYGFPPPGLTTQWFGVAFARDDLWQALGLSVRVALVAMSVALVLGTLAAAAMYRFRFFGKETVTLLILLPIALPGIVTGMSLRAAFDLAGLPFSFWTVVLGHATFCIVVVYNNVIARFRRSSPALVEVPDLPPCDPPQSRDRPDGRRHAGLRPLLRRDHRDDLHRRQSGDPADLHPEGARPPA
jgi:putative spermidine/putrescine transport system permease protein